MTQIDYITGFAIITNVPAAAAFIGCLLALFARKLLGKPVTASLRLGLHFSLAPFAAIYMAATGLPIAAWVPWAIFGVGMTIAITLLVLMNGTSGSYTGDMALRNLEEEALLKKQCHYPFVGCLIALPFGMLWNIPTAHLLTYAICLLTGGVVGSLLLFKFCGTIIIETHPESDARMSWREFFSALTPPTPRIVSVVVTDVKIWFNNHGSGNSRKNTNL